MIVVPQLAIVNPLREAVFVDLTIAIQSVLHIPVDIVARANPLREAVAVDLAGAIKSVVDNSSIRLLT